MQSKLHHTHGRDLRLSKISKRANGNKNSSELDHHVDRDTGKKKTELVPLHQDRQQGWQFLYAAESILGVFQC